MSAARLRAAARVLRERAEDAAVAHGIDWRTSEDAIYRVQTETADGVRGEVHRCYACGGLASTAEETATFIATMHPGVALALADWLDDAAQWKCLPRTDWHDAQAHVIADLILVTKETR